MKSHIYILHGWAIDQFNDKKWQPIINGLKKQDIDSTFLKLPGLSSPLNEVWDLDDYVSWVHKQIPEDKNVILLGHSFGGQIAIKYSAKYSDQVEKLILIDSAGIIDKRIHKVIKRKLFWVAAKIGKPLFKLEIFRKFLYKFARESDYKNAPPLMRKVMSNVISQEVLSYASKIQIPTQIIWGEQDMTTPLFMGEKYHSLIRQSKLDTIPNARHSPQFTHVDQVIQIIKQFVVK